MKKIVLSGKSKVLALNAMKGNQEGYKGIDRIRTGLKVLHKLEDGLPSEGNIPEEVLNKSFELILEDVEFNLLKSSVDVMPWAGTALQLVSELCDSLDKAEDVK